MGQVLLVDDDPLFCESATFVLAEAGLIVDTARSFQEGMALIESDRPYGVMIFDFDLPGRKGDELALQASELRPEVPILFSTGQFEAGSLKQLLEAGVSSGFFAKGLSLQVLRDKVQSLLDRYLARDRVVRAESAPSPLPLLIGEAPSMARTRQQIERYRSLSEPLLLLGESGTGKELAALGFRREDRPWIAVNCAKFLDQEGLLESELFGHVKGSFTGAHQDHKGLLEEAGGGVLFLDEVHTLTLSSQQKMLRVLQEGKYRRVGETKERTVTAGFRLLAAAKDDLFERVQSGSFLADFYFRIHTLTIELAPLRERLEDLELLCQHFLRDISVRLGHRVGIRARALSLMKTYAWPGNVRELKNCLYRMAADSGSGVIESQDFGQYLAQTGSRLTGERAVDSENSGYEVFLQEAETKYFKSILAKCTSRDEVLRLTGISKSTLYRKLSDLQLDLCLDSATLY